MMTRNEAGGEDRPENRRNEGLLASAELADRNEDLPLLSSQKGITKGCW